MKNTFLKLFNNYTSGKENNLNQILDSEYSSMRGFYSEYGKYGEIIVFKDDSDLGLAFFLVRFPDEGTAKEENMIDFLTVEELSGDISMEEKFGSNCLLLEVSKIDITELDEITPYLYNTVLSEKSKLIGM